LTTVFPKTNNPRSLPKITALDVQNHSCTASDSKIFIKVPLLIVTSMGTECDEGTAVVGSAYVQDKTEIEETC
jgi:hypothetical protein